MNRIELWSVEPGSAGPTATLVASVDNAQTEASLEELFVKSPNLLQEELYLIGRQVPTDGGPLDLLGVDEDGRLVVFELKRGTLTRDAVAQAVDYASDLAESDTERITRLVQDYSGRLGIEKIADFEDWYAESFPNSSGILSETPSIVLVGLGADDRARRMVNFLADSGVDIQLLTFQGFEIGGKLLLARQVESVSPARPARQTPASPTKEANLQVLHDTAKSLGVLELLEDNAAFVSKYVPGYQWPGKTAYTFSLAERTSEGNPSLRSYLRLDLNHKKRAVTMTVVSRAVQAAPTAVESFQNRFPADAIMNRWSEISNATKSA